MLPVTSPVTKGVTASVTSPDGGDIPVVFANFASSLAGDWVTLSSTSTMPPGGSISRAGNAMLYDSTGKLTYAPNNLLLNSNTFNGSGWVSTAAGTSVTSGVSDPLGGTSAWTITATSTNGYFYSNSSAAKLPASVPSGIASVWIRRRTGTGTIRLRTNVASVDTAITVTSTWTRVSVNVAGFDGSGDTWVMRIDTNGDAVDIFQAQLEAVTYQTTPSTYVATTTSAYYGPRFDYDPVTLAAKGLLVEGTRTNVQPYSNSFNSWIAGAAQRASFNLVSTTQPDGTSSGYALIEDSTAGIHQGLYGSYNRNSSSVLTYTATVYAKSSTRRLNFQVLDGSQTSGAYVTYDLAGGQVGVAAAVFGTYTNPIATMQNVGGGWYRCRLTFTSNVSASFFTYFFLDNATGTAAASTSYTGNGTSGVNVFGVQIEEGAFPTSYIPVPAASTAPTNTRSPDAFTLTGYANRLVEAYYIDEQTGANFSGNSALSTGTVTISPPTFGWVTSLRAYQNAYAGSISSPSWLSFSRAGNAMYYDSTGTLTWAPANLLTYSQAFESWSTVSATPTNNTSDTTSPDNSNTASKIVDVAAPGSHGVYRSVSGLQANTTRMLSAYIKKGSVRYVALFMWNAGGTEECGAAFDLNNITATAGAVGAGYSATNASIVSVGSGWYRCSVLCQSPVTTDYPAFAHRNTAYTSGTFAESYSGSTANYSYIWGAQLERVTYQTAPSAYIPTTSAAVYGPRYDYDPSTVPATPRGLLIEESRSNIATYSDQLNNAVYNPVTYYATVSSNAAIAPDGTVTADKVIADTSNNAHILRRYDAPVFSANTTYTWSVYAKDAGYALQLQLYDGVMRANTVFNLTNGTISSTAAGTATITPVGNGWYRCSVTATTGASVSVSLADIALNKIGTGNSFVGDGVSGLFIWGAQLEAGSFATSYIPTTTASVTRAADVAQLTGSALTVGQGASGSAIAQFDSSRIWQGSYLVSFDNSATAQYYNFITVTASRSDVLNNNVTQASLTYSPAPSVNTTARAAFAWAANNFAAVANNGTVQPDTSGTVPTGITTGYLGYYRDNLAVNGHIQSLALYNTRLPDAILKQKSVVNAPY